MTAIEQLFGNCWQLDHLMKQMNFLHKAVNDWICT